MIPNVLAGVSDTAALIQALSEAEKALPGAVHAIAEWVAGGPVPDPLPPLPDLQKNEIELAAMKARAGKSA